VKRGTGLRSDPAKTREWQQRSRAAALGRQRTSGTKRVTRITQRPARNDGPWRREVFAAYGAGCVAPRCGRRADHAHHIVHRSMCGPSVVENGMPLCRAHHDAVHAYLVRVSPDWLTDTQIDWLDRGGHARWEDDGTVSGAHCKLFAPLGEETEL